MRYRWRVIIPSLVLVGNIIWIFMLGDITWTRVGLFIVNLLLGWFIGLQIDQYRQSKEELSSTKNALMDFTFALDSSIDAIAITTEDGKHEFVNEEMAKMYGYTKEELMTINWEELFTKESLNDFNEKMNDEFTQFGQASREVVGIKKDGTRFPQEISVTLLRETQKTIVVIRNITKKRQEEVVAKHKAEHNELTNLPNRRKLLMDLEMWKRKSKKTSVLFIDLDRFKMANDTLGHEAGDRLLVDVGERLTFFSNDFIKTYHLRGDEFLVVILDSDMEFVKNIAIDIGEYIQKPFYIKGNEVFVTASIGISSSPDDTENMSDLLNMADTAMYYAKLDGKNTYKLFNKELKDQLERRTMLEQELRKAIRNEELYVLYQPKFNLKTSQLSGLEALIRWESPILGSVSPVEFIPIAEDTGMIDEIGNWVISEVLYQMRKWQDHGYPLVKVSVNVSQRQFRDHTLIPFIESCLYSFTIEPRYLEIEVTESVIEHFDLVIPKINALKELGIGISIDDFGTGYSSLNLLKNLPIDTLKIDQSFVRDLIGNSQDISLVKTFISIGKTFNLNVVAEGIETEEHLQLLSELECPMGQGYFFSKPIRPSELEKNFFN